NVVRLADTRSLAPPRRTGYAAHRRAWRSIPRASPAGIRVGRRGRKTAGMALTRSQKMSGPPTILSGAFERHNFGDLLMGRVVEHFLRAEGMAVYPTGILPADLRGLGGLRVHSFADLAPCLP